MTAPAERLIAEALAKSGVIWLTSAAGSSPVWYAALNDVAYFVTGPEEQKSPVHDGTTKVITRSKETRARLLSYDAQASTLTPENEDWEAAITALIAGRLNAPAGDVEARWRENNTVVRLTPDVTSVVIRGERITPPAPVVEETTADKTSVVAPEAGATTVKTSTVNTDTDVKPPTPAKTVPSRTRAPHDAAAASAAPEETIPEQPAPQRATPEQTERAKKSPVTPAKTSPRPPSTQPVTTPPVVIDPSAEPSETSPRNADTQPIPVRPRKRQAETTQPIPVRNPSPRIPEVTQPIPVRDRTRRPGSSGEGPGANMTKVDQ